MIAQKLTDEEREILEQHGYTVNVYGAYRYNKRWNFTIRHYFENIWTVTCRFTYGFSFGSDELKPLFDIREVDLHSECYSGDHNTLNVYLLFDSLQGILSIQLEEKAAMKLEETLKIMIKHGWDFDG